MIEELLPPPVHGAEAFGDDPGAVLFPGEEALISRGSPRRRGEFATARGCARAALARLGHPPVAVLADELGAPLWPDGVTGSITHCAGYRAAAVAYNSDVVSVGLDAAPNRRLRRPEMLTIIARDSERARLAGLRAAAPGVCWDQMLFSAKESVYKAWYPLVGRWLGFASADITFDVRGRAFSARLLAGVPPALAAVAGTLCGTWVASPEILLTAVIARAAPCTATVR
jgi:4'-phosphopantetheinyl transferase EntD